MLFGGHFDPLTFTWPLPTPTYPYPSSLLTPQQLLAIQEELNNKKSELEQAKEEQSHTQALLKVLQEQVSEPTPPLLSQSVQTLQTRAVTRADRAQGNLQETNPVLPPGIHNAIPNHSVLTPSLMISSDDPSPPKLCYCFLQKTDGFWYHVKLLAVKPCFKGGCLFLSSLRAREMSWA